MRVCGYNVNTYAYIYSYMHQHAYAHTACERVRGQRAACVQANEMRSSKNVWYPGLIK